MSILNTNLQNNEYDLVICGGGLAAQTLARQLKLNDPEISINQLLAEVEGIELWEVEALLASID